jgi:hypothetical protein
MTENVFHAGAIAMFVALCIGAAIQGGRAEAKQAAQRGETITARQAGSQPADGRLAAARCTSYFVRPSARPLDCYGLLSWHSARPGARTPSWSDTRTSSARRLPRSLDAVVGWPIAPLAAALIGGICLSGSSCHTRPSWYYFGTTKKKAPSVSAKCLFCLPNLVGAIGLEPTTPTMSRWENGTSWDPLGRNFTREKWQSRSHEDL